MAEVVKKWKVLPGFKGKDEHGYPRWLLNVLANRGVDLKKAESFLEPKYEELSPTSDFKGIAEAVERIAKAKETAEKVVVYGDYDVDGITTTAIVIEALKNIGIVAEGYIPHREEEGYGLNKEAVAELQKKGTTLIIAVDCGITSKDIIDSAKGVEFIVCDHHEISEDSLPQKAILIHPDLVKKGEPRRFSAGGMAFFLARGLQEKFPKEFLPGQEKWLLDLVALSTICDVVPLKNENRILAKWGLLVLSKTKRRGLVELMKVAGIEKEKVGAYEVGFLLGPRLNAAGRLSHAQKALRLLLTDEFIKAKEIAEELNRLNTERQELCTRILEEAKAEIEKSKKDKKILVVSNKKWPRGVVGIIASKISDTYGRPAIVFENDGKVNHGSARSVEGFDITEALHSVSEYLAKFGGHAKAAGLTVENEKLVLFEEAIEKIGAKMLAGEALTPVLDIDTEIAPDEITDEAVDWVLKMEPFGYGNTTPIFKTKAKVRQLKKVGQSGNHLKFAIESNTGLVPAIYFNAPVEITEGEESEFVFTLKYNWWKNRRSIDMRILDTK